MSYDVTCALTNTRIVAGDLVAMILLRPLGHTDFDKLRRQIAVQLENKPLTALHIELISQGKLSLAMYEPLSDLLIGEYDGAGGVDGYEFDNTLFEEPQFYHLWALEAVMDKFVFNCSAVELAYELYHKMLVLRKNPLGVSFIGKQQPDPEGLELAIRLNELTNERLKAQLKRML